MFSILKKIISNIQEARIPRWLLWVITIGAGIGFLDTAYLSIEHVLAAFGGGGVNCVVGAAGSCNIVLESIYSKIYGIPLSYLGLLYYTTILIIVTRLHSVRSTRLWHLLQGVITFGFLMSVCLVYLQLHVLRTICPYCMLSASMSTIMFVGVVSHRFKK